MPRHQDGNQGGQKRRGPSALAAWQFLGSPHPLAGPPSPQAQTEGPFLERGLVGLHSQALNQRGHHVPEAANVPGVWCVV